MIPSIGAHMTPTGVQDEVINWSCDTMENLCNYVQSTAFGLPHDMTALQIDQPHNQPHNQCRLTLNYFTHALHNHLLF